MPNILFITADHLRYDTLGCHGDPIIQTPNLDRLASESACFSNFFVQSPVCQPSRASMMTGRYPRNHGVRHNGNVLDRNETTLVEHFKQHGYTTAVIGKHHVSQERFRKVIDHLDASGIRRNWKERPDGQYIIDKLNPFEKYVRSRGYEYKTGYALPGFRDKLGAVPSDLPEDCHLDAYVGMKACEYLESFDNERPLFMWVGFYGPHHPYVPSGRFARMYDPDRVPPFHKREGDLGKKPVEYRIYVQYAGHKYRGFDKASDETFRAMKAAYYGMVSQLDWKLGHVLDVLRERGIEENTIVVFTSDHGEFLGDHGIPAKAPFLLDCMLHVPLMIRVPGVGQRRTDELVESVDLFPTLTRLAGIDTPEWVQGRDLCPLMRGDSSSHCRREAVYAEMVDKRCIRTKEWKYIHYPGKDYGELYDLREDPYELNNLYAERPNVVARMRAQYNAVLDATEDFIHPTYPRFTGVDPATGKHATHYLTW